MTRFRGRLTPSFEIPIDGTTATPVRRINWWLLQILSSETITHAHRNFFQPIQTVQIGHGHLRHPVELNRPLHQHRIEPTTTACSARRRAEFTAHSMKEMSQSSIFRDKRTAPYPCGVGLQYSNHSVNRRRRHSRSGAGPACSAMGTGHEGISAMIHIQKSSLCTLDQNPLPRSHCAVSQGHPIRQVRSKKPSGRFYFSNRLGRRDFYPALTTRGAVMQRHPLTYPPSQLAGWQGQLSCAKSYPSRFIRVGRSDPPPCRANFSVSPTFFEPLIHRAVMRENKMCLRRQMQTTTGADPPLRQPLNLFDQPRGINHRTTRNQTGHFPAQNS